MRGSARTSRRFLDFPAETSSIAAVQRAEVLTVNRIRLLWFVLVPIHLATVATAQDWRDDDSIWAFDGIGGPHREGPRTPDPAPIRPDAWIAVPNSGDDAALLAFPWILDPERAAPRHGDDGWTAKLTSPSAAAACAFTTVASEHNEVRMARLTGARFLVVNGSVHIGDPERRGDRGVPVALVKGENEIFVVDATAGWELELWKPATRIVIGTWDVGWPDVTGDEWDRIQFPVFNASSDPVARLRMHHGAFHVPTATHPNKLERWSGAGPIAPLTILHCDLFAWSLDEAEQPTTGRVGNRTPVVVYADDDDEAARELLSDLDPSRDRVRLMPSERERRRTELQARPQARIPGAAKLVYGTQGDEVTTHALLARARFDQQILWYECGEVPEVIADTQLVARDSAGDGWRVQRWAASSVNPPPVVVYGDVASNAAWTALRVSGFALEPDAHGVIRRNEEFYGEGFVGADAWSQPRKTMPDNPHQRYVYAFASRGAAGARLSLALGMLTDQPGLVRVDPEAKSGFSSTKGSSK